MDEQEIIRYDRHIKLKEIGLVGQQKLKDASVLVVGAGGLGAPLLSYLAAAGIGHLGIIDNDVVDISNLQRQVLFSTEDVGKSKVDAAKARIQKINPYVKITAIHDRLNSSNALEIVRDYDVVADGSDNFATRYLVNDACAILNKINVYGSIFQFEGQVSVFNFPSENAPNYRDLFPTPPPSGMIPNCIETGVLGVLPGIIGSIQANEVIKVLLGIGTPLVGRMFIFDALRLESNIITFKRNKNRTVINSLIDYDEFCNIEVQKQNVANLKEVTVQELKNLIDSNEDFQLIDVREIKEFEEVNINGTLLPMGTVLDKKDQISSDKMVIIHCRSGVRSANVIRQLEQKHGFTNLYNLKGGILAWVNEINSPIGK